MTGQTGLKRVLGLGAVTFIAIGFMVGGGVFAFTGVVANICGPALPIAYGLAVIPVFISMLPMAMLAAAIPTTGANYVYPSRMVSPALAFLGIWVYALASFVGQIPLYALTCTKYIVALAPGLPNLPTAVLIVTVVYVVNLLGVRLAAVIQGVLVLLLLSALAWFCFSGIGSLEAARFDGVMQKGFSNLILGTALLTFTYLGANGVIELGGEIINPGKVIPRSFAIAFAVVLVLYVAVAVATMGNATIVDIEASWEPLLMVAERVMSRAGVVYFIVCGAVLALLTTLNALFIVGTKSLMMICGDEILPKGLGALNRRFGTPHWLLTVVWALSVAGILGDISLVTLASFASLGAIIVFFPILIASLRLRGLHPAAYEASPFKLKGIWYYACPVVGFVMMAFLGVVILVDLRTPFKIGSFVAFAVSGMAYYWFRRRWLAARGVDIRSLAGLEALKTPAQAGDGEG